MLFALAISVTMLVSLKDIWRASSGWQSYFSCANKPAFMHAHNSAPFSAFFCFCIIFYDSKLQVRFFLQMDDQLLDTICEVFVSSLSTEGACIVREGDPDTNAFHQHMTDWRALLLVEVELVSSILWCTGLVISVVRNFLIGLFFQRPWWTCLPLRIVRTLAKVEAFGKAESCSTLHFYSHHWRTWAACFIQAAWHRYRRRKMAKDLSRRESFNSRMDASRMDASMLKEDEVNIIPRVLLTQNKILCSQF